MSQADPPEPVKQRAEPVPCLECGRTNWSEQSLCVYCRLGWPDPGDMRGISPDREGVGTLRLGNGAGRASSSTIADSFIRSRDGEVLLNPATDEHGRFDEDLKCIRCHYNLRGLRHEDRCPECSEPVERSLLTIELAAADPRWLGTIETGAWLLFAGLLISSTVLLWLMFLGMLGLIVALGGLVVIALGIARLTSAQHRFRPKYHVAGINEMMRVWSRISMACIPLGIVLILAAFVFPPYNRIPMGFHVALSMLLMGMFGVCGTTTMLLLKDYAAKLNRRDLSTQCSIIAALFATIMGTTLLLALAMVAVSPNSQFSSPAGCVVLLLFPLGIYASIIVAMLARELERAAKIAGKAVSMPR